MRQRLLNIAWKSQFEPGLLSLLLNPFHFARTGLYRSIAVLGHEVRGKVLDVGCGQKPYEPLFSASEYVGLELDTLENRRRKRADRFYDGTAFPFSDGEFDSVVLNQVIEHVFTPDTFLQEVNRVLKQDGVLLLTVPFLWDEHEQPVDFARYSSFGLRHLLERNGFLVTQQKKTVSDIRVIFQMLNAYLYKKTTTPFRAANALITLFCMMPINVLGELAACVLPRNDDLYLDNVVLARKTGHA